MQYGIRRAFALAAVCALLSIAEQGWSADEAGGTAVLESPSLTELTLPTLAADRTFTLPEGAALKGLKEGDLLRVGPGDKLEVAPEVKQAADTAAGCLQALRSVAEADTVRAGRLFQALSGPK